MNKGELMERIAEESGLTRAEAQRCFDAFERTVTEALRDGEEVQITGFGKFEARERAAREGVNPQTKEKMQIPAKKVPSFSAGNSFKEAIR